MDLVVLFLVLVFGTLLAVSGSQAVVLNKAGKDSFNVIQAYMARRLKENPYLWVHIGFGWIILVITGVFFNTKTLGTWYAVGFELIFVALFLLVVLKNGSRAKKTA